MKENIINQNNYSLLAVNNNLNVQKVELNKWLALILIALIFFWPAKFDKSKDFWI